jgi:hypothetical protein
MCERIGRIVRQSLILPHVFSILWRASPKIGAHIFSARPGDATHGITPTLGTKNSPLTTTSDLARWRSGDIFVTAGMYGVRFGSTQTAPKLCLSALLLVV